MEIFYSNKEDPRTFVYRDENGPSGLGVTFNFAHRKAKILSAVLLFLMLPLIICPILIRPQITSVPVVMALYFAYSVVYVTGTLIICYRGAARDLREHQGLKGPRPRKGEQLTN